MSVNATSVPATGKGWTGDPRGAERKSGPWLIRTQLTVCSAQFAQRSITQTKNFDYTNEKYRRTRTHRPSGSASRQTRHGLEHRLHGGGSVLRRPGLPGSSWFCDQACPAGYLRRCNWFPLIILLIFKTPELNSEKRSRSRWNPHIPLTSSRQRGGSDGISRSEDSRR